ncbi:hypothetical protein ACN28S_50025 [Cystobacter fuscus]
MKEVDTSRARFDELVRQLTEGHLDARERELMEEISRADKLLRSIARELHLQRGAGIPVEQLQPPSPESTRPGGRRWMGACGCCCTMSGSG